MQQCKDSVKCKDNDGNSDGFDRIDRLSVNKCSVTERDVDQDVGVNQHHDSDVEDNEVQKAEDDLDQENIPVLQDQNIGEDGACDIAKSDLISFAYQLADGMVCVLYESFIVHFKSHWILCIKGNNI